MSGKIISSRGKTMALNTQWYPCISVLRIVPTGYGQHSNISLILVAAIRWVATTSSACPRHSPASHQCRHPILNIPYAAKNLLSLPNCSQVCLQYGTTTVLRTRSSILCQHNQQPKDNQY